MWLSAAHRACMAGAKSQSMIGRSPTLVSSARPRGLTWPAASIMLKERRPALYMTRHEHSQATRNPCGQPSRQSTRVTSCPHSSRPAQHQHERDRRRTATRIHRDTHARTRRTRRARRATSTARITRSCPSHVLIGKAARTRSTFLRDRCSNRCVPWLVRRFGGWRLRLFRRWQIWRQFA